jgi:adenosylhomocysteine nucleosidase
MDATGLGFAHGTTPLDPMQPVLHVPRRLPDLIEGRCGSGDSFVNGHQILDCDVVDMEAYALAKVSRLEEVEFMAVKYITDGGDNDANKDWSANLPHAATAFRALYDRLEHHLGR